jgi:hypothetical protein
VRIDQCNSIKDFRLMARRRLPGPIFHYIGGAADDEVTYRRNTGNIPSIGLLCEADLTKPDIIETAAGDPLPTLGRPIWIFTLSRPSRCR